MYSKYVLQRLAFKFEPSWLLRMRIWLWICSRIKDTCTLNPNGYWIPLLTFILIHTRNWQEHYLIYAVCTLHCLYIMYISMQYSYILHCCVKMYKGQESDNVKSSIIGYFDFLPLLIKRFQISIRDSWLINESFNVFTIRLTHCMFIQIHSFWRICRQQLFKHGAWIKINFDFDFLEFLLDCMNK